MRLTPEEVVALDVYTLKRAEEYRRLAERDLQRAPNLAQSDAIYACGGGMNSFAVNAYGEVGICIISQQETFSVRNVNVKVVWEESLLRLRNRKRTRITKCIECRIQSLCGMCPANGELENGDRENPVAFLCNIGHLRAEVLGIKVPAHGSCEFCPGGSEHDSLHESVRRIRSKEIDVDSWVGHQQVLPILNNSQFATGCGSCGNH